MISRQKSPLTIKTIRLFGEQDWRNVSQRSSWSNDCKELIGNGSSSWTARLFSDGWLAVPSHTKQYVGKIRFVDWEFEGDWRTDFINGKFFQTKVNLNQRRIFFVKYVLEFNLND